MHGVKVRRRKKSILYMQASINLIRSYRKQHICAPPPPFFPLVTYQIFFSFFLEWHIKTKIMSMFILWRYQNINRTNKRPFFIVCAHFHILYASREHSIVKHSTELFSVKHIGYDFNIYKRTVGNKIGLMYSILVLQKFYIKIHCFTICMSLLFYVLNLINVWV